MRKTVVITLSKRFQKEHSRSGEPTQFAQKLNNQLNTPDDYPATGKKKHTIRANFDRWKHNIDKINNGSFHLSIRQWIDVPYKSKQEELFKLSKVGYQSVSISYDPETDIIEVDIDEKPYTGDIEAIAQNDGLSLHDFKEWFFAKAKSKQIFNGVIIHFTDFRY